MEVVEANQYAISRLERWKDCQSQSPLPQRPRPLISNRNSQIENSILFIAYAHLDLAYNALRGREVLRPASEQRADEDGIPSVGLPDLRRGLVGLICATIYCEPDEGKGKGYRTADEANAEARRHVDWYHRQFVAGELKLVRTPRDLPSAPAKAISTII